jgi:hypothetical protein
LTPENVAETTPGWRYCVARLSTAARLYLNSLNEAPTNRRQIDTNFNDYNFVPMEICRTRWFPDITDRWR